MGRKLLTKSGQQVIGMASELKLKPYLIPKDMRKVLENNLKEFPEMTQVQKLCLAHLKELKDKTNVQPDTYLRHFKLSLYMEEYQKEMEMRMYDLKNQQIRRYNNSLEFLVHVPGLSEDRPSLQLYNEVELKATNNAYFCHSSINFIGQDYVKIVSSKAFAKKYNGNHLFNIRFLLPRRTIQCSHYALELVNTNRLVPVMFPEVKTCYNTLSKRLDWFNKSIGKNAEQKQAIVNIVARTAHPAPYILFGPPGTGKTATLVEAISQIWKTSPSSYILVCTPSNAAADEILKRLLKNIPEKDTHRMYGSSRKWEDVDRDIQPCSNFADGELIFLPKELIILRRIVIVTVTSCARLLALKLRVNHFSYVFVDEAGQATEPETLIPVGLMSSTDSSHIGRLQGQLVLAGDPMQLGPSVTTRNLDTLGMSMLERLMKQGSPYKKSETGKYNASYITKLVRNFRSNKSILNVPNNLFYEGELIECGKKTDINRALNCSVLPNKSFPMIFHPVNGEETREPNSPSRFNMDEVWMIIKYLNDLIGAEIGGRKLEQKDIAIITPFKLQRVKIHRELEKRNWTDVSVGTVEIFQGQERDVIIMSTVRSCMYIQNGREQLGFLSNPKRFNVAVTRAKSMLITIGNPTVLQFDKCWDALMRYCDENKAFVGGRSALPKKLTNKEKSKLFARKHKPVKTGNKDFQFPDLIAPVDSSPGTCLSLKNLGPKRKPRVPEISKNIVSNYSLIPATSVTNGSVTDSVMRGRTSSFSSNDGCTPTDKNDNSFCDYPYKSTVLQKNRYDSNFESNSSTNTIDSSEEFGYSSGDDKVLKSLVQTVKNLCLSPTDNL